MEFEKLFLATKQGAEQIRFTRALKEYAKEYTKEYASEAIASGQPVKIEHLRRSVFGAPVWAFAAAAIILIAVGAGIWLLSESKISEMEKRTIAFNKAYERQRPTEARLTGLPYASKLSTRGDDEGKVDRLSLRQAELTFIHEVEKNPGAESYHALGRVYLAQKDFDQAINQFQKALGFAPESARIHSDLGAAYLEKGKAEEMKQAGSGKEDLAESLKYLNKAIDLDQNLLEARFNRALLYQQNSPEQAINEWQEYLKRDSDSPRANEAREK